MAQIRNLVALLAQAEVEGAVFQMLLDQMVGLVAVVVVSPLAETETPQSPRHHKATMAALGALLVVVPTLVEVVGHLQQVTRSEIHRLMAAAMAETEKCLLFLEHPLPMLEVEAEVEVEIQRRQLAVRAEEVQAARLLPRELAQAELLIRVAAAVGLALAAVGQLTAAQAALALSS